jgi:hypothetical protein
MEPGILPYREALKNLAAFSVNEEFCQKSGGRVFGYAGLPTAAYWQLCFDYAFLLDRMTRSLIGLKSRIPVFKDDPADLGDTLEDRQANDPGVFP